MVDGRVTPAEAFRRHGAEALASLIRLVGDFDLAEEGLQEAFAAAAANWKDDPPANPRNPTLNARSTADQVSPWASDTFPVFWRGYLPVRLK